MFLHTSADLCVNTCNEADLPHSFLQELISNIQRLFYFYFVYFAGWTGTSLVLFLRAAPRGYTAPYSVPGSFSREQA